FACGMIQISSECFTQHGSSELTSPASCRPAREQVGCRPRHAEMLKKTYVAVMTMELGCQSMEVCLHRTVQNKSPQDRGTLQARHTEDVVCSYPNYTSDTSTTVTPMAEPCALLQLALPLTVPPPATFSRSASLSSAPSLAVAGRTM